MTRFFLFLIVLFTALSTHIRAQELPPIASFYPEDYNAGDQNWAISQDTNGIIYVANNKGLLEFNGSQWVLYPTPNHSIIRSVKSIENKVYTGQYRDFGFWERNALGEMVYTSLVKDYQIATLEDEEFWGVASIGNWLMFQSLDRIYLLNVETKKVDVINSETTLTKMILANNTIYFQKLYQGIFKIDNGEEVLVTKDPLILGEIVVDIRMDGDRMILVTQNKGIFEYNEGTVKPWVAPISEKVKGLSLYSAYSLKNNHYVLGSISNGMYLVNTDGNLEYQINKTKGLANNTVLSIFEDSDGNIWLGLDNGICVINQNSPFKVYYDEEGLLGTVYVSQMYNDILFLGTNQGLFYKNEDKGFSLVPGTEGQVWGLYTFDDKLFCGHDRGTFLISDTQQVSKISDIEGAWAFRPIEDRPELLLQGGYNGLYILEKVNDSWGIRNKIEGFDISTRYFEFLDRREILMSHEYKGVYKLEIDETLSKIVAKKVDSVDEAVNSSLIKFENQVLYSNEQGVYKYDAVNDRFHQDATLQSLVQYSAYVSGKLMLTDADTKIWYASKDGLSYVEPDNFSGEFKVKHISLPIEKRASKSGYENILGLGNDKYLLGTTEGYIVFDLKKVMPLSFKITLNKMSNSSINGEKRVQNLKEFTSFKNKQNNFEFKFSTPRYHVLNPVLYQHRLKGLYDEWSDWSEEPEILFENLPYGYYTFEARSRIGDSLSSNTVSRGFEIERPWYLSITAILIYILILLLIVFFTHTIYRRYYKRQREQLLIRKEKEIEFKELEAQQQIMKFRNQNLQLDIESKSRELGLSTMNLIKKNELLGDIRNQLVNIESVKEVKGVVKKINQQLNATADWKLFEEAFNNADKDFLKNIKTKHPELTSNDLRLCAYLRLNLSSKEIAPLLNISHKSVEVKRYRLRKKMDLDHNVNLTDYILQI